MFDVSLEMENRPGQLARMGETLGAAGLSVEGGGMFLVGDTGMAHFLFEDGPAAATVLRNAGFRAVTCKEVVVQRLDQETPGQLGTLCRAMADAGVNIETLYSDHDHRLILTVDDPPAAHLVAAAWEQKR